MQVIITSPSLDPSQNISGISSVTSFIMRHNTSCSYSHFSLGKADAEKRGVARVLRNAAAYIRWIRVISVPPQKRIHFNLALDRRGLLRDLPLIMMARALHSQLVVHIHGGEFLTGIAMPKWARWGLRITIGAGPVIVLSEFEKATLSKVLRNAAIFVLANCAEVEHAEIGDTEPRKDPLTLLFLGRISEKKGLGTIYDALEILKDSPNRLRFVLAGTGPDESLYVPHFQSLLGDRFEFAGLVKGADKSTLLRRCDLFLLPSHFEGLPMSLLECMAFGIVPITTAVGSIPTVVKHGHNGVLVHKDAPQEIAEAIERLSRDRQQLRRMGQRARNQILETCSPDRYIQRLNEIYAYDDDSGISRSH